MTLTPNCQVTMPWGEPAWMLAIEWIPGTPGSLYHLNNVLTDGGETKYRDFEPFMRLVSPCPNFVVTYSF